MASKLKFAAGDLVTCRRHNRDGTSWHDGVILAAAPAVMDFPRKWQKAVRYKMTLRTAHNRYIVTLDDDDVSARPRVFPEAHMRRQENKPPTISQRPEAPPAPARRSGRVSQLCSRCYY